MAPPCRRGPGPRPATSFKHYLHHSARPYLTLPAPTRDILVHLYAFLRGISYGYSIPHSPEAKNTLFHVMIHKHWELLVILSPSSSNKMTLSEARTYGTACFSDA
jgi:hypothetical protein